MESSLEYVKRFSLCNCLTVHELETYTAHAMTLDLFLREVRPGTRLEMPHVDRWPSGYVRVYKIPRRISTFMLSPFNEAYHPIYRFPGFPSLYTMGPHPGTAWLKKHAVAVERPSPEAYAAQLPRVEEKIELLWGNVNRVLVIYDRRRAPADVRARVQEYDQAAREALPHWPVIYVDGPDKPNPEALWCHYTKEARTAVSQAVSAIEDAGSGRWPAVHIATARATELEVQLARLAVCRSAKVLRGGEVEVQKGGRAPDVLWASKSTRANTTPEAFVQVQKKNPAAKLVFWDGDVRADPPAHVRAHGDRIDVLLVGHKDAAQAAMLRGVGAKRLETFYHGVRPEDFPPPRGAGQGVFFGGTNYLGRDDEYPLSEFRYRLVEQLREAFDLKISGDYWPARWASPPDVRPRFYSARIREAAVSIGCNHFDLPYYYTKRLFDSLAAGRLHVTRYIPGMEADFENHRHLVWFETVEEAVDLVSWYLTHNEERERIAAAGRRLVFEQHTEAHRARELAGLMRHVAGKEFGHG